MEDYVAWREEQRLAGSRAELDALVRPGKLHILPGCIFRRSRPAIVGVEIQSGMIKPGYRLMLEDGREIGSIKRIQDKGKDVNEARAGMQVAISIDDAIVGRHIDEGNMIYVSVPERHAKHLLTRLADSLSAEELEQLNQLVETRRKTNPLWAF
jgi:translation initiation factor 5B